MTMTSGFFDSVDHDRRYTALQWGQIMDYLINDGVYLIYPETGIRCDENGNFNQTIQPFKVTLVTDHDSYFNPGLEAVSVGPGRAWFDHTWTWVQSPEIIQIPEHNETVKRIDVLVLTMDKSFPQRSNYFRVLQGKPGVENWKEAVTLQGAYMHNDDVHDVPIAYIVRTPGVQLTDQDIHSLVGMDLTPYVENVAEGSFSVSELFGKWDVEWENWLTKFQNEYDAWHELFGNSEEEWKQEWGAFLDNRAADFMRWLKVYDRAYHTWYQGSVNWVYEYIRRLNLENEDFEKQWADVIQRAQDMLEHGLEQYTQKIEDILKKFEDIDTLVEDKMAELQSEFDRAVQELKDTIADQLKETVTTVVTEQMETIVQQVIEKAGPDIAEGVRVDVENIVNQVLDEGLEGKLEELKRLLAQYQQEQLDALNRQIEQINQMLESYNTFIEQLEDNIWQKITEVLGDTEAVEKAIQDAVANGLNQAIQDALGQIRETWCNSIKQELSEALIFEIDRTFTARFEKEKAELIQYIKDRVEATAMSVLDQAVEDLQEEIAKRVSNIYTYAGTRDFAGLPEPLTKEVVGFVYNMSEGFTTDDRFVEGPDISFAAGTNVAVALMEDGSYKFDVLAGTMDLSMYITRDDLEAFRLELEKDFLEAD